jgi:HlyD family secretion protein
MAARSSVRWAVILGLALIASAGLAWLFRSVPVEVSVASVRRGEITEVVSDQGQARVRQSYTIAAPVAGRLERIGLEVGDRVIAGETVAARLRPTAPAFLDPRMRAQAEAAIAAARSALEAARADSIRVSAAAARASADLDRTTALVKSGAAAQQQLDDAITSARTAHAAADAAVAMVGVRQAELRSATTALADPPGIASEIITVRSPASGVVTHVIQQSERSVVAGTPLVEIGDTSGLEAQIEFLSQDAVRIRPGLQAEIYDWGGPGTIPAEVRRVEPQAFTKTRRSVSKSNGCSSTCSSRAPTRATSAWRPDTASGAASSCGASRRR